MTDLAWPCQCPHCRCYQRRGERFRAESSLNCWLYHASSFVTVLLFGARHCPHHFAQVVARNHSTFDNVRQACLFRRLKIKSNYLKPFNDDCVSRATCSWCKLVHLHLQVVNHIYGYMVKLAFNWCLLAVMDGYFNLIKVYQHLIERNHPSCFAACLPTVSSPLVYLHPSSRWSRCSMQDVGRVAVRLVDHACRRRSR